MGGIGAGNPIRVAVAAFVGVACIFSPPLVIDRLGGDEMGALLDVAAEVEEYAGVDVIGVSVMHRIFGQGNSKNVRLVIETDDLPADPSLLAAVAADCVIAGLPDVESVDAIEVMLQQFYYLLESLEETEGAPFYLYIDLTPEGDDLACLGFSVASFAQGVPEGLE